MARGLRNIKRVKKGVQPKGTFGQLKGRLAKQPDVKSPGGLAAAIGREKFGPERFQKMAAAGRRGKRGSIIITPSGQRKKLIRPK